MKKIIFFLIVFTFQPGAFQKDPKVLLNRVKENFEKIKDYKVNAQIKLEIDFLRVPEMDAVIYFKQPDKMKFDSKGFAMLPKQAFNLSPLKFFDMENTAVYTGSTDNLDILRIIPESDTSEVIFTTLWIDSERDIVKKIESTVRRGITFQIQMDYDDNMKYPLPSGIIFTFDTPEVNLPRKLSGKPDIDNKNEKKSAHPGKGVVTIVYKNYEVNKGLPDSLFEEKNKN